jgi:hypothetical protein
VNALTHPVRPQGAEVGVVTGEPEVGALLIGSPAYEDEAWRPFPVYDEAVWGDDLPTLRVWLARQLLRRPSRRRRA